jgi:hypothetical protein
MAKRRVTKSLEGRQDLPRYLVWVRGLTGPEPQKWTALDFGINDWKRAQILAYSELSEEDRHLSLTALASRFPPPPVRD